MTTSSSPRKRKNLPLRHVLATLAYRASKAVREAPPDFSDFQPGEGSRSAGDILAHMGDLMEWALSQAKGEETWNPRKPRAWQKDCDRFFDGLSALDAYVASSAPLAAEAERIFQGAIADALTHVGQIAMLRRLAGSRVRGENYSVAKIAAGQAGLDQPAPVREFGD
jgi:hypothetical protein